MVCDGIAGVGASGNAPVSQPAKNTQQKQDENSTIWDKRQEAGDKLLSAVYDMSLIGIIDKEFDLGIKENLKKGVKNVREGVQDAGENVKEYWENYTVAGQLYKTIFDSDE